MRTLLLLLLLLAAGCSSKSGSPTEPPVLGSYFKMLIASDCTYANQWEIATPASVVADCQGDFDRLGTNGLVRAVPVLIVINGSTSGFFSSDTLTVVNGSTISTLSLAGVSSYTAYFVWEEKISSTDSFGNRILDILTVCAPRVNNSPCQSLTFPGS